MFIHSSRSFRDVKEIQEHRVYKLNSEEMAQKANRKTTVETRSDLDTHKAKPTRSTPACMALNSSDGASTVGGQVTHMGRGSHRDKDLALRTA